MIQLLVKSIRGTSSSGCGQSSIPPGSNRVHPSLPYIPSRLILRQKSYRPRAYKAYLPLPLVRFDSSLSYEKLPLPFGKQVSPFSFPHSMRTTRFEEIASPEAFLRAELFQIPSCARTPGKLASRIRNNVLIFPSTPAQLFTRLFLAPRRLWFAALTLFNHLYLMGIQRKLACLPPLEQSFRR